MSTGHYFQSLEKWTLDADDAFDFGLVSKAIKVANKLHIRDLELVLTPENPAQVAATPFQKFLRGLSHNEKHHVAGRRVSRSAALA
jgi:hypothetical protein